MQRDKPYISFVIPCYNEADRFFYIKNAFAEFDPLWHYKYEIIIVNDGSSDETLAIANAYKESAQLLYASIKVVDVQPNQGKGNALKTGVAHASADWILTLDADMAASPLVLLSWMDRIMVFQLDTIYIGSRTHKESDVDALLMRRIIGGIYNLVIRLNTSLQISDTQCGFKLYPVAIAKEVFEKLVTVGWAHDIEILARAKQKGAKIENMPLKWVHREGAKINVFTDGLKMFAETIRIGRMLRK